MRQDTDSAGPAADPANSANAAHDDEVAAQHTLDAAGKALNESQPAARMFFDALFRNAAPEDISRNEPQALAAFAQLVFEHTARRQPGETLIALFDPKDERPDYARSETVFVAVNDDMPFLFDSLVAAINAGGARIRAAFHPIIQELRDANGKRDSSQPPIAESVIVLVLDPVNSVDREILIAAARSVFAQVKLAVRDWKGMQIALQEAIDGLQAHPPRLPPEELNENIAFLEWLGDNHYTFLGCRDYSYSDRDGGSLERIPGSGLGLLSDEQAQVVRRGADRGAMTPQVRAFLQEPAPLIITKSDARTLVHRRAHMDYIGVKRFDAQGRLTGERRFVGLFTSNAYSRRPGDIPLLRMKRRSAMMRASLVAASHDAKTLAHILDTFPRDELFQISADELYATAMGILRLGERPKVRVFLRFDRFDRFVSALVYLPRDRYDTAASAKIHSILARAFNSHRSAATPILDDSALARVHYIVGRDPGPRPRVEVHALEAEIRASLRTWQDGLEAALAARHGEAVGAQEFQDHASAFSERYCDTFSPEEAVADMDALYPLRKSHKIKARAYRRAGDAPNTIRMKIYGIGEILPLSVSMPIFENLGLRVIAEDSYPVSPKKTSDSWLHEATLLDFLMERRGEETADLTAIRQPLEDAFHAIVEGRAESDGLNRLVLGAGLAWRDVVILRIAAKYLRQAGLAFSQDYIEQALARNPEIAALLVALFYASHDPAQGKDGARNAREFHAQIDTALRDVPSLDDDRIIRRLRNVIDCTLRTNFFQPGENGEAKRYISIKLDSRGLEELPAPRPLVEIFVYSPEVEGVHLRFGRIARGGLRWSDRREDFRTEVLGLVKAQQVKNAVIVPVGAKGGFYPKQTPANATRDVVQEMGIAAYKTFINALLDLTDNIAADGRIVPPQQVRRHDGDDPYLVVAADKGTATFSDIANGIAESRGFWLGDAFASGGSHGYDHKAMGITAKGAWVAVKRHFREMGRDIQSEAFTCIGVGDMSGDVFGNGMLLSEQTRLLAAFDHRHIFLDPDPDPAISFAERKRMFALPRSSWDDYNKQLVSAGGGVYSRSVKEIALTPQVKALAGLTADQATPAELMKALLKADIDLLWFGGIGTFIKSNAQSQADAGDRANDAVRIDGRDVKAKVIGEGANLGATQLGRIEYAAKGGRINTDAIDNSAGVDTSDHEVNLKILLSGPLRRSELSAAARDELLTAMTEDVAAHVLKDNYDQTLALSVAQNRAVFDLDAHGRYMRDLERRGKLDRAVEYLPDDEALRSRAKGGKGLTRPELAVLLAYAKLDLDVEILDSGLPDEPYFTSQLAEYFPPAAVNRFPKEMEQHRLRREIVATALNNRIVNLAGPVFIHRMKEGASVPGWRAARAFVVAEGAFGLSALKSRVDALDYKVDAQTQTSMYADIAELLRRLGLWFLANVQPEAELGATIALYRAGVESLRSTFSTLVSPFEARETEARIAILEKAGVPHELADEIGALPLMGSAPEIAQLASTQSLPIDLVAGAYFAIGRTIGLDRLRARAVRINASEHWDRLAIRRTVDDLFAAQRALTIQALADIGEGPGRATRGFGAASVGKWAADHAPALDRMHSFIDELERDGELSIAKLTLANSQVHQLAQR